MKSLHKTLIALTSLTFLTLVCLFSWYVNSLANPKTPIALTQTQQEQLNTTLDTAFPGRRQILHPLPYPTKPVTLDVGAESAILIDFNTGSILYEKNADELIPPASMTKIVVMYIVFKEIVEGRLSLTDVVPLTPDCYAVNLPRDASLMFLNAGQSVTVDELLTGLAVDSGNDAAIALANHISGSVDAFVARMNEEIHRLGLIHTHFVEPSGYDENNITTAKEFAAIARNYIQTYPKALEKYHSRPEFSYPLPHNLPGYPSDEVHTITQHNTNKLLPILEGCDGLKTGFIYESRYNLALTAKRGNNRFISVTMKGPGVGSAQGNQWRIHDGTTMMEWAFSSFCDYTNTAPDTFTIAVPGAKEKYIALVPAFPISNITVPFISGNNAQEAANAVKVTIELPPYLTAPIQQGAVYGTIVYTLDTHVLQKVPLVADRSIEQPALPMRVIGKLASLFLKH
ncbi:MAG: D-alanyl-D-alanine carboxypeptidase [Treponema sp.]|nr:D-alanyl-D-alanine carboxypeptidase [Treponema sp.]